MRPTASSEHSHRLIRQLSIVLIIIIGAGLRLWSINHGLTPGYPVYHMEEPFYTHAAQHLACEGDLDESLLQAHTYTYALTTVVMQALRISDWCSPVSMSSTPSDMVLIGRLISVFFGTATLFVVYLLGAKLYSQPVGIISALFTTLNFLHVRESHHGTPDITTIFLSMLTLYSYLYVANRDAKRKHYLIAGILTALSINGRLTNVLLILPLLYAHFYGCGIRGQRGVRAWLRLVFDIRLIWAGVAVVLTWLIVNPQLWVNPIDYLRYWRSFFSFGSQGGYGRLQIDVLPAPLFYVRAIEWGSGLLLALLMAAGVVWAFLQRQFADVLLLMFLIAYFVVASITTVYFARYSIPMLPLLGLLAARLLWDLLPVNRRLAWIVVSGVILLIQPVERIVQYSRLQSQINTRVLAGQWIEENIPPASKIATEWHSPVFDNSRYAVTVVDFCGLSVEDLETYRQQGYEYLIVTSFIRDTHMLRDEDEQHKRMFYQQLAAEGHLIHLTKNYIGETYPPFDIDQVLGPITYMNLFERPGPTIEIYHLDT